MEATDHRHLVCKWLHNKLVKVEITGEVETKHDVYCWRCDLDQR